ncbi:MAG: hypothetical protein K2Q34_08610 [Alphaproteobacteria bacterium]|nr:hypothetical protein [Alphaproteobacteria bacterium]
MNINHKNIAQHLEYQGFDIESNRSDEEKSTVIELFKARIYDPIAKASTASIAAVGIVAGAIVASCTLPHSMTRTNDINGVAIAVPMILIAAKAIASTGITNFLSCNNRQFSLKNTITTIAGAALAALAFSSNPIGEHADKIILASLGGLVYGSLTGTKTKMIAAVVAGFSSGLAVRVFSLLKGDAPRLACVAAVATLGIAKYLLGFTENTIKKNISQD